MSIELESVTKLKGEYLLSFNPNPKKQSFSRNVKPARISNLKECFCVIIS